MTDPAIVQARRIEKIRAQIRGGQAPPAFAVQLARLEALADARVRAALRAADRVWSRNHAADVWAGPVLARVGGSLRDHPNGYQLVLDDYDVERSCLALARAENWIHEFGAKRGRWAKLSTRADYHAAGLLLVLWMDDYAPVAGAAPTKSREPDDDLPETPYEKEVMRAYERVARRVTQEAIHPAEVMTRVVGKR